MAERFKRIMQHHFHPTILRAYDIRGIVGETLFNADAVAIGLGLAAIVKKAGGSHVVIGRDGRLSSPELSSALAEGLVAGGMKVSDIGTGPTPKLYFADLHLNADAAIQVTGSHNPPTHNGFKMVMGHKPFFAEDITALGKNAASGLMRPDAAFLPSAVISSAKKGLCPITILKPLCVGGLCDPVT